MANKNIKAISEKEYVALIDSKEIPIRFGGRTVEKMLGVGANGAAFLCLNKKLNRKEVVKVWLPKSADAVPDKDAFLKEVRLLAKIKHENIVDVYDAWVEHGLFLCSMEYIDGIELREWLNGLALRNAEDVKEGAKPQYIFIGNSFKDTLKIMETVFSTIVDYQEAGLVHGDIHGNNILLDAQNNVHIIDFGSSIIRKDSSNLRFDTEIYHTWSLVKKAFSMHIEKGGRTAFFTDFTKDDSMIDYLYSKSMFTVNIPTRRGRNARRICFKDWSYSLLQYIRMLAIIFDAKHFTNYDVFRDYCDCLFNAHYLNKDYFLDLAKKDNPKDFEKWYKAYTQS